MSLFPIRHDTMKLILVMYLLLVNCSAENTCSPGKDAEISQALFDRIPKRSRHEMNAIIIVRDKQEHNFIMKDGYIYRGGWGLVNRVSSFYHKIQSLIGYVVFSMIFIALGAVGYSGFKFGISSDHSFGNLGKTLKANPTWILIGKIIKQVSNLKSYFPGGAHKEEPKRETVFDINEPYTIVKIEDGKAVIYSYAYDWSVMFVLNNYLITNLCLALMLAMLWYGLTVRIKNHRREALLKQLYRHTNVGQSREYI